MPTTDPAAVEAAIRPETRLLWIESPGNPLLSITDIAACADIAHRHRVLLGVDSTFATPVLTRPLELGADIVMHSATKYLGGHSDLLGGALVVARSGPARSGCTSSRTRPARRSARWSASCSAAG